MIEVQDGKGVAEKKTGTPLKFYILVGLTTLFALASSFLLSTGSFLYGSVALIMFLTMFVVESLFVSSIRDVVISVVLNTLAFALLFLKFFSLYFIFAVLLLFFLLLDGSNRGRRELNNMIKIRFARIVRVVSRSMIAGVVIFLSVMLILSTNFSVSPQSTERGLEFVEPIIQRFIEDFRADAVVGELLENIVTRQLSASEVFMALSPQERSFVIERQATELKTGIEERIGTEISLDATVAENVYDIIDRRLSSLTPRTQIYWGLILVAAIWLSIQSVEFILFIPLAILVFLVYELLFALKFAKIENITKSKEIISLK